MGTQAAPDLAQQQVHSNGLIVMPLQDTAELPASVPAGYPDKPRGGGGVKGVPMEHTGGRPTPMFHMYYNQPSYQEMQAGAPAPVVQGAPHMGPMNTSAPLYCAPNQDPVFLGATVGHHPIPIHCGACGYQGLSHVMQSRGWAHGMWAMMTCGLGLLLPIAMDTHHFCPNCRLHVATAKLM